jgi:hypothetical protein
MIDKEILGVVAGILSFFAYSLYIYSTVFGKTKPNRVTWWILTFIGLMIASSYYFTGGRATMWIALSYVLGPLITAILSLKYGEGTRLELMDKWCLAVAIGSVAIWYVSQSAILALFINIFLDFVGILPTIKKSYFRPEGEDRMAWTIESLATIINLFAIERAVFIIAFYPVYLFAINGVVTVLLYKPLIKKIFK